MRPGQDVQLFASGDSKTSAKLAGWCEIALRLNPAVRVSLSYHMNMLDEVCRMIDEFGVLHFRIDVIHPLDIHDIADRTLTTLHGRLDLPNLAPFHAAFLPLVSIFNERQNFLNNENWPGTIQHGLPPDLLPSAQLIKALSPSLVGFHPRSALIEQSRSPRAMACR